MANLYQPGRPAQYGSDRWSRYETLRVEGFTKTEARELSRNSDIDNNPIIAAMRQTRARMIKAFDREVRQSGMSEKQARTAWPRRVSKWYRDHNLTSKVVGERTTANGETVNVKKRAKGGRPDLRVWYNRVENNLAKRRGWKKGNVDPATGKIEPQRRGPGQKQWGTGHGKWRRIQGRGNVKAQKARAKLKARAMREGVVIGKNDVVPRRMVLDWIREKTQFAIEHPERAVEMNRQISNLRQQYRIGFKKVV